MLPTANPSDFAGVFGHPAPANGMLMLGTRLAEVTDGTSNTALFSEVRRGTLSGEPGVTGFNFTTNMIGGTYDETLVLANADGRTVTQCNSSSGSFVRYVGQQYYRALPQNFLYTHTLPPNWNRQVSTNQKYSCGNATLFNAIHMPASSYHPGVVVVCLTDGSVRPVSDTVDFAVWQAAGTKRLSESSQLP
jgi:hypothetical protein